MTYFVFFKGWEAPAPPVVNPIGFPGPIVQNPKLLPVKKKRLSKKERERIMLRRERERRDEESFILLLMEILDDGEN